MSFIQNLFIALVIFGVAFITALTFISEGATTYNQTVENNLSGSYGQINDSFTTIKAASQDVYNSTTSDQNSFLQKTTGAVSGLGKLFVGLFQYSNTVLNLIATEFGIPGYMLLAAIAILLILITLSVMAYFNMRG